MSDFAVVRLAEPGDAEAIGRVTLEAYVSDGFLAAGDDYADQLSNADHRVSDAEVWVATVAGAVVGSVTFCPPGSTYRELAQDGEGEFRMLSVAPEARGKGVARALVAQCLTRSRELGNTHVVICSLAAMTKAHALYESMGFRRDEALDWEPAPGFVLLAFRLPL